MSGFLPTHLGRTWFFLLALAASAFALDFTVTSTLPLDSIASMVQGGSEKGAYRIGFKEYANPGRFRITTTSADTLIFYREGESDAVLDVRDVLFDLKGIRSTVIFRNLAFRLTNPAGVLLSGSDEINPNGPLVFDSCIIHSDYSSARFIAWNASPADTARIVNTMVAVKDGAPSIALRTGTVHLENNSFQFAGHISTVTQKAVMVRFNTFNRTQLAAEGGVSALSDYFVKFNLFAFAPKVGVLGGASPYPIRLRDFNPTGNSSATDNQRFQIGWSGWEPAGGTLFQNGNNKLVAPVANRDSGELWKWHQAGESVGYGFSPTYKAPRYNVFPTDDTFEDSLFDKPITFKFQRSLIPRVADAVFAGQVLTEYSADLRPIWPDHKGIKLGVNTTFILISMLVGNLDNEHGLGEPILLAADPELGVGYMGKEPGTNSGGSSALFTNSFPTAQFFHPAFKSEVSRGRNILPKGLVRGDTLRFDSVSLAGNITILNPDPGATLPRNARYLGKSFGYKTNAQVSGDSVTFGMDTSLTVQPYDSRRVSWFVQEDKGPRSAERVNGSYLSRTAARQGMSAFLIEVLAVPRGADSVALLDGMLQTRSVQGFQLSVDSTLKIDSTRFSEPTRGYRFSWAGRGPADTVRLVLHARSSELRFLKRAFQRNQAGDHQDLGLVTAKDSTLHFLLAPGDTGQVFFAAIENNVLAGKALDSALPNVTRVSGFTSSVSGRLDFKPQGPAALELPPAKGREYFRDVNWLGGVGIEYYKVAPTGPWSLTIPIAKPKAPDSVRAYYTTGDQWILVEKVQVDQEAGTLTLQDIPNGPVMVVAVEAQMPATAMVAPRSGVEGETFKVAVVQRPEIATTPITHYCVEMKEVDNFGDRGRSPACEPLVPLGQEAILPLVANWAYQYRIRYFAGTAEYGVPPAFEVPPGLAWSASSLAIGKRALEKDRFHLAGFPLTGTFRQVLRRDANPPPRTIQDLNLVMSLRSDAEGPRFQAHGNPDTLKVKPGHAVLVGSARPYSVQLDPSVTLPAMGAATLSLDTGWQLLANPFPINCKVAHVRSNRKAAPRFFELELDTGSSPVKYSWKLVPEVLRSFAGYAYKAEAGETLEFDLFRDPAPAPKRAGAAGEPVLFRARLESPAGNANAWLSTHPGESAVGHLASLGGGIDMRLGGGAGFLLKPLADAQAMDEPLTFRSPRPTRARFRLSAEGGAVPGGYRLLDLATGAALDPSQEDLNLPAGERHYRLVAGSPSFLAERLQAFRAGAPAGLRLLQNHPNPFRGVTRIALDWPAVTAADRTAFLEVLDMAGRRLWRSDLRDIRVGRQELAVDASAWKPGVYVYRLVVRTGGLASTLEKRMVVLP